MSVAVDMAPVQAQPLEGAALEAAARAELCRQIGLRMTVRSPTWRQIVFGGQRVEFKIPAVPEAVLGELSRKPTPDQGDAPTDETQTLAGAILHHLQQTKPQGVSPRSISPRRPLPPQRGAVGAWGRKVFLIAAGPECLRLLAASGICTSADVGVMSDFYPKGLDAERVQVVEAAMAIAAAANRTGHDAELPAWLNDQLWTVMGESRPVDFYGALYAPDQADQKPQGHGTIASAPKSRLIDQTAPTPAPGEMP